MDVLLVSSRSPWPPNRADQLTVERLVRYLAASGDAVDLACFVESRAEETTLRAELGPITRRIETVLLPRWQSVLGALSSIPTTTPLQVGYFAAARMRRLVARLVSEHAYSIVYAHLIRTAEYARALPGRKVLGLQVAQGLNFGRMADYAHDPFRRFLYREEATRAARYEVQVCRDFDRVVLVAERDVREISKLGAVTNAVVCPHGQDIPAQARVDAPGRADHAVIFSGVMGTATNQDAAHWLATAIWPRVCARVPEACLWVVGRWPSRALRSLHDPPRIVVTGEVPDVYDWLCKAAVAVDPLRVGAGIQNKVLQAMACETPVVMTSVANEGIGAIDGSHALVRDDPESFADAVVQLLEDKALRARLGRSARAFVAQDWTWDAHFRVLRTLMVELSAAPPVPGGTSP